MRLRPVTRALLLVEALDVLTTVLGLCLGCREANGLVGLLTWPGLLAVKAAGIVIVCAVLECKRRFWADWAVPLLPGLGVAWNVGQLVARGWL